VHWQAVDQPDVTKLDLRVGRITKAIASRICVAWIARPAVDVGPMWRASEVLASSAQVWHHPESDKLFCEEIDVGEAVCALRSLHSPLPSARARLSAQAPSRAGHLGGACGVLVGSTLLLQVPRQIASGLRQHYTSDGLLNRCVVVFCNLKPRNLAGFKSNGMVLCASQKQADGTERVFPSHLHARTRARARGYHICRVLSCAAGHSHKGVLLPPCACTHSHTGPVVHSLTRSG
jgi:tRNA-binding EMAP/Myf-like protein